MLVGTSAGAGAGVAAGRERRPNFAFKVSIVSMSAVVGEIAESDAKSDVCIRELAVNCASTIPAFL